MHDKSQAAEAGPRIGFIGPCRMELALAGHVLAKGRNLMVHDLDPQPAHSLVARGGADVAQVAREYDHAGHDTFAMTDFWACANGLELLRLSFSVERGAAS